MTDITESDNKITVGNEVFDLTIENLNDKKCLSNEGYQVLTMQRLNKDEAKAILKQILQNQKDAQEYRKIKDESVILKKQDIEKEIQLLIDTTKLPSEPNKIRNEIVIEYLRKLLGKCYCGLEFNKH